MGVGSRRVQLPHDRTSGRRPARRAPSLDEFAVGIVGTDWETFRREGPGVSAFVLEDGVVYHTYSAYARGLDGLWGMYQWLDRAPLGRNETGFWWRRHDEYERRVTGRQSSIREPMITVRSIGRLKYSAASAVRWEVARNRLLRQRLRPGASPRWRSIVERK